MDDMIKKLENDDNNKKEEDLHSPKYYYVGKEKDPTYTP